MRLRSAICFAVIFISGGLRADQIEMQNGDRYAGKVLSMTADGIVLQSEVLGKITLPREKVVTISLAANSSTAVPRPTTPSTNAPQAIAPSHRFGASSNVVAMVRRQFLSDAGPEATSKFDELAAGLFTGKFDMEKIRAEAKSAADQIRELKRGGDVGEPLNSYLVILDKFLKQTATPVAVTPSTASSAPATNSAPPAVTAVR